MMKELIAAFMIGCIASPIVVELILFIKDRYIVSSDERIIKWINKQIEKERINK